MILLKCSTVNIHTESSEYIYICASVCERASVCVCVCMSVYVCVCVCVCLPVYMYSVHSFYTDIQVQYAVSLTNCRIHSHVNLHLSYFREHWKFLFDKWITMIALTRRIVSIVELFHLTKFSPCFWIKSIRRATLYCRFWPIKKAEEVHTTQQQKNMAAFYVAPEPDAKSFSSYRLVYDNCEREFGTFYIVRLNIFFFLFIWQYFLCAPVYTYGQLLIYTARKCFCLISNSVVWLTGNIAAMSIKFKLNSESIGPNLRIFPVDSTKFDWCIRAL